MLLNEKISMIRKMNNLTQESFAGELAVSRQAVSKWEKGDSVPDVQMITKIADNYNITLDQLIRNEYDLPGMKELSTDIEKEEKETPIQIERYIGKICDVSMNSFRYSVIRNIEIIGICNNMVCFIKNRKYGYFNLKKSMWLLYKK
ncbi:helix-turn-helix protein [anaerobic digester metagenome]